MSVNRAAGDERFVWMLRNFPDCPIIGVKWARHPEWQGSRKRQSLPCLRSNLQFRGWGGETCRAFEGDVSELLLKNS